MTLAELYAAMEAAAARLDYEEARRLRDRISLARSGGVGDGDDTSDAIDPHGLTRQQPGAMGLGTSRQQVVPPAGWTPPAKPDPMTKGRSRRQR